MVKSKIIWILNHYATNTFLEHGGRHYCFAKYLMRAGYSVRIFCASTVHNSQYNFIEDKKVFIERFCDGIPYVFIRTRNYRSNGIKRVLNILDFYKGLYEATKRIREKPDIIIGSSVHPLTCIAAIKISRRYKIRNIVEIRDLWPESLVDYGLLKSYGLIARLLYRLEKWIYVSADDIVFTMEGGRDYIVDKKWDSSNGGPVELDKVHYINNGVDLEVFHSNLEQNRITDPDLDNPSTFKVVYTGSIRKVNDLSKLVYAGGIVHERTENNIMFLIYGDGDQREELKRLAIQEGIKNIRFKGKVEKKYIPYILSKCDLAYNEEGQFDLFEYGSSSNKLFEYLAAGLPILMISSHKYSIEGRYNCSVTIGDDSPDLMAEAILKAYQSDLSEYHRNALHAAYEFSYELLTEKLIEIIER